MQYKSLIEGISVLSDIVLLKIQEKSLKNSEKNIFSILEQAKIPPLLIARAAGEKSLCLAIENKFAKKLEKIENRLNINLEKNLSIITIDSENMKGVPGVSAKFFNAMAHNGINVIAIAQGASEFNISAVVAKDDESKALASVKSAFSLTHLRKINVFLLGTGLIGTMLLKQIKAECENLKNKHELEICLCGLANSDKMILNRNGIELNAWENFLASGKKSNIEAFIQEIKKFNLVNSVVVDCTASEDLANFYEKILNGYISIVTPNKKANSGPFHRYKNLKNLARKKNVSFLYEATVGAGLPIINTLRDLLNSGDEIVKIEAVLSGTLSYIFNTFSKSEERFSEIVKKAQKLGYTEPDPRDDLNGLDVARKILILARETGLELEPADIKLEPLINKECELAKSQADFFSVLTKMDADFQKLKQAAEKEKKVLRYIAILEKGKAKVLLQAVGPEHPFYSLSGSDNMVSFTTKRYHETPLVVKGPGAGAEVTAGGVLADILRIRG